MIIVMAHLNSDGDSALAPAGQWSMDKVWKQPIFRDVVCRLRAAPNTAASGKHWPSTSIRCEDLAEFGKACPDGAG